MDIKPIETIYKGYRFRSRLEARWAVFFDTLGVKYEYEPEGFDLGEGTYYLPDFYLYELGIYVEIKPAHTFDIKENEEGLYCENNDCFKYFKFASLCVEIDKAFLLAQGDPFDAIHFFGECRKEIKLFYPGTCAIKILTVNGNKVKCNTGENCNTCKKGEKIDCCCQYFAFDNDSLYCYVPKGIIAAVTKQNGDYVLLKRLNDYDDFSTYKELPDIIHNMCLAAETARQARFEHGECG